MHIITIKLYFVLVIFIFTAKGVSAQVPINLTSTRSAMIISVPDDTEKGFAVRGDWKKIAREAHDSFRKIGIDGVLYIYKDDLTAGPEITKAYNEVLIKRLVSNMISLEITGTDYNLEYVLNIYPVKDAIELNQSAYRVSSKSLNELMLVLGRQVLRQETPRTNFLITDQPEFLDDLVLYSGTRYVNVPSRIRSLGIAVIKFDSIAIPDNLSEIDRNTLITKNLEISQANLELDQIMKKYPFKYELVNFTNVESLYQKGYQYALMPIISSGHTIKKMLNYKSNSSETVFISEFSKKGEKATLKKIPANGNMTKYYIKQTIGHPCGEQVGCRCNLAKST
jgi:hypothetical protein